MILSNDTDYDDIVGFWKTELNVTVKRRDKFEEAKPAAAGKNKTAEKTAAAKAKTAEKTPAAEKPKAAEKVKPAEKKAASEKKAAPAKAAELRDKTEVNNAVMKALSAAKFDNEIAAFAASQVTKLFSEKNGKQLIYRSIISKYGQEQGLKIYREIKKLL